MRNRKAFALSINFIVILILAIAIFALGLHFSYQFMEKADVMKAQLDAQTEAQIESYLSAGEIVAIGQTKKMISDGGAVFGLGVLNVGNKDKKFTVEVNCSYRYDVDGSPHKVSCSSTDSQQTQIKMSKDSFNLKPYEDRKIAILITPEDRTKGLHSFVVKVYNVTGPSKTSYGDPQLIYVEIP